MRGIWIILKTSVWQFINDDALTLAGALAFFTALALAPLLVLIIWVLGLIWGDASEQVAGQVQGTIGSQSAEVVRTLIRQGSQTSGGWLARIIGLVTLLVAATGVFAQLQYSLNRIWNVQPRPDEGVRDWLRRRVVSLGMILAIAFVLLVSLVVSAFISAVIRHWGATSETILWQAIDLAASLGVYVLLFAATFVVLPDVKIGWKDVLLGSLITAVLFAIGKFAIGLYLGRSGTTSVYGAAGSFVVMLLWLYYSALILFFGAELTKVYVESRGRRIEPDEHAVRIVHWTEQEPKQGSGRPA
jgi:membrane protein